MGTLTKGHRDRAGVTLHAKSVSGFLASGSNVWVEDGTLLPAEREHGKELCSCIESRQGRKKRKIDLGKVGVDVRKGK